MKAKIHLCISDMPYDRRSVQSLLKNQVNKDKKATSHRSSSWSARLIKW